MKNEAVTEAASAAATMEEALESGFLPTDDHYRLTGEFAGNSESKEEKPGSESSTSDDKSGVNHEGSQPSADTAAASAAASTQEKKGPAQTKSPATTESRQAKLSRENKELREKLARMEAGQQTAQPQRETQQESQPAAQAGKPAAAVPKPKLDDVDPKTGKPKYANYQEYEDARDQWVQDEAIRKITESSSKTEQDRAQKEAQRVVSQEWGRRATEAKKKYADFDAVALNPSLPIKQGSVVDGFILTRPSGTDVLYHLGKHPDVLAAINAMNPIDAAYALSEIEFSLKKPAASAAPAKVVSQATRPPNQVSGEGTVAKETVEQAVEESDFETYRREANARDLAKRGK